MILNETRDLLMKRSLGPTASSPPSCSSSELISNLTVTGNKIKSGSDNCLAQLVEPSTDQATKIEQFSRKLSEFDLKLNGFKSRSGHHHRLNLTNSTTTISCSSPSSTRLTTISPTSPTRSTTGLGLIRSSLPNSHLTDRELEKRYESDSINIRPCCDLINVYNQPDNIDISDDVTLHDQRNQSTDHQPDYLSNGQSRHCKQTLTCELIKRRTSLPRNHCNKVESKKLSPSWSSKSLQSSPIDSDLRSINCLSSSTKVTSPFEYMSSSVSSPRRMLPSGHSGKFQSETKSSSSTFDCVDYVSQDTPRPRVSRFTRPNVSSKETTIAPCSPLTDHRTKSNRSYSRLNSLPCNNSNQSVNYDDCASIDQQQRHQQSNFSRNQLRALSIPNGLNSEPLLNGHLIRSYYNQSQSVSRESVDCCDVNCGETGCAGNGNNQRTVGSLLDSPKWSIIKEKFEKSNCSPTDPSNVLSANEENKDKCDLIAPYSSPQPRRKTYPTTSTHLTPSLSLSNLTLLASTSHCNKNRPSSLTPPTPTPTMDKRLTLNCDTETSNNNARPTNRNSTLSLTSTSSSSSSTLTNGSYVTANDMPNRLLSSGRLISTSATHSSSSPSSPSSHSQDNHGNYPMERISSSGKINLEHGSRMKSNSRIARIASKFDINANQSSPITSSHSNLVESKIWKSKSDLFDSNSKTMLSTSTSSISTSTQSSLRQSSKHLSSSLSPLPSTSTSTLTSTSSPLSTLVGGKLVSHEEEEDKIVSVKETILRLECIKSSSSSSLSSKTTPETNHGTKINRSISEQHSTKPVFTPRRKTLPGATFLHNENRNGDKSQINSNYDDGDNLNCKNLHSSNNLLSCKDVGKAPLPTPRRNSNTSNQDSSKGLGSSTSTSTANSLLSSSSSSFSSSTSSLSSYLHSSSVLSRHGHDLNKEPCNLKGKRYTNDGNCQQIPKSSSCLSLSSSSTTTTSTLSSSKIVSLKTEDIKKTPSFLWSNRDLNNSSRLTSLLSSSLTNVKESICKPVDIISSRELNQCEPKEATNLKSNIVNNSPADEPIYEPVSYSPTPIVDNFAFSINKNLSSICLTPTNRDNRCALSTEYDDNLSVTSENSSLTYSDPGSYSSGVHEASTLSTSSTSSSNRSINKGIHPGQPSTPLLPPPLPPRWTEAGKCVTSNSVINTFTASPTVTTTTHQLIIPTSSYGLNLATLETYISNQWNNKEDYYGADHIYDSIHYSNLADELNMNKSEMLSKLLKELEDMSPSGKRKVRETTTTTSSLSMDNSMSRTPSTLSCSSISRNGSNASEKREKGSEAFSPEGVTTLKTSERNSSSGSIKDSGCSSTSPVPPKITPRTTIKSSKRFDSESTSSGYANFPSILEDKASLMDSIMESSSPSLRETLQREIKRSECHSRVHQSETLTKNTSFLHSNRLSVVSKKSSDYVEAIDPADQKKANINDLYREGLIHPESRYETHEYEGYMEFTETRGFFSSTADQPLYQLYDEQVKHNRILWASGLVNDSHEDDVDPLDSIYAELDGASKCACSSCESEIDEGTASTDSLSSSVASANTTPHISAIDLVGKNGNRQLWCEVPQVKETGVAAKLTPKERKHQEAMFEVITSEASYLKSLDILVNHFMKSEEFSNPEILNPHDKSDLFSNIESVFEITRRLMKDLDDRWQTNVVISDVSDILLRYATSEFEDYVKYLRFCKKQEKTLKTLQKQPKFAVALKQLEANPKCHGLALTSFLLLPMQRITRYPLLVEAILNHRPPTESEKYEICQKTLAALYKVVNDCNEEAKKTERLQELIDLDSILNFDKVKYFPLISESRYLMKKDEVVRWKQTSSSIIPARGRNPLWKKSPLHLYLFNDLLLIASKKSDMCYSVNDYCERNCLTVRSINVPGEEGVPPVGLKSSLENLVQLTFLKNHARRTSEYYISFPTETDKIRFIEAIEPPKSDKPNEKIYEEWDCPQVICERQYTAQQPDELSLEKSDVVNVFRKTNDWYEGERIRDGARGWFPASCTQEIVNKHVRSRNLKLRHRLMTLTEKHILEMHKNQPIAN